MRSDFLCNSLCSPKFLEKANLFINFSLCTQMVECKHCAFYKMRGATRHILMLAIHFFVQPIVHFSLPHSLALHSERETENWLYQQQQKNTDSIEMFYHACEACSLCSYIFIKWWWDLTKIEHMYFCVCVRVYLILLYGCCHCCKKFSFWIHKRNIWCVRSISVCFFPLLCRTDERVCRRIIFSVR